MQAIPDLATILTAIPWCLVGGLATRAYMPERSTLDVDILIHERDEVQALQQFLQAGYRFAGSLSIGGFSVRYEQEAPIDVLTRADGWVGRALQQPFQDAGGYPVLPLAYLILMKLEAGRPQDLTDCVRMLIGTSSEQRDQIRTVLEQARSPYLEDYDQLVLLADLGMA